ncbi:flagellar basal body rod protein FlgC [Neotabrizicola shimadae]|uniref:Flagellar basal body rod protein FlgC n=1 Tax=Neotabrizicola shimadae TaxID=2807096 RepID=A0A8G0ZW30_9RHOB|nr:flagellar basal body rod protein FlgC [Neotabrizicola shimadae]QYZ69951.1 flagellar basal body rod protein FlgC [Neotabrizicola shimadae]
MGDLNLSLGLSASGMEAQATRLRHISENIANADTPGYRRKVIGFSTDHETRQVVPGPVQLDNRELRSVFDPGNPLADESGHFQGSNVDLVIEIADAREAQRGYEANLRIFDQARQMAQGLFDLLRR